MLKKTLAVLATAGAAVAMSFPAHAAKTVYAYHGSDVGWATVGARSVGVQDRECDQRGVHVVYKLADGTVGRLHDYDECLPKGRQRNFNQAVKVFRVCEATNKQNTVHTCSNWKTVK